MKVLITGKNSYLGNALALTLERASMTVEKISLRENPLDNHHFTGFDVVVHVAGIAHVQDKSTTDETYFSVNRDLAVQTALKAKKEGVKQFIFFSSIILFGPDQPIGVIKPVDVDHPKPHHAYAKSKLEADLKLQALQDDVFKVAIMRLPMVYGPQAKGNFSKLMTMAKRVPIYPKIHNQRSVIYIENLNELIKLIIEHQDYGVFYPQNAEYLMTNTLILKTRQALGKRTLLIPGFTNILRLLSRVMPLLNKLYGNKMIPHTLSNHYDGAYQKVDFITSIKHILETEAP